MSTTATPIRIIPMKAADTHHFIERAYREGGRLQWVRETYKNAEEAGATRTEFGTEWQAVESLGVYRRTIADNGCGMTAEQLEEFFNTFGGSGKAIGGMHENYGVGSKTSLLPWNRYGMVVISWVAGNASMIWVMHHPITGEYGLKVVEATDPATDESFLETVYEPYNDLEHGCDWSAVKPEWIDQHGTVIILLGNNPRDNTVIGDPSRSESDIKGISSYLNRRIWQIPEGTKVVVDELRTEDVSEWPRSIKEAHGPQPRAGADKRTNRRNIEGARHFIDYPVPTFKHGKLQASGTVRLSDGTDIDWYLWDGDRPAVQSYAAISGYAAALYQNELYGVTGHHSTYRSFGISEASVRGKLWLIARPPLADDSGKRGVYPRTDRNALLLRGGPGAGGPLPFNDWAAEFNDHMPQAILDAIKAARGGNTGTLEDASWRARLAERFGSRWRIVKLRAYKGGVLTVDPTQQGTTPIKRKKPKIKRVTARGGPGGRGGGFTMGVREGSQAAKKVKVAGGIPRYRTVRAEALGEGMLAAWQPNDPVYPEGAVLLNQEHPVLRTQIEYWQSQFADHYAEAIEKDVIDVYGQIAVAKVAHSEHMKGILPSNIVENDLRSESALTMALLGLVGEEAVIGPRLAYKYRKRRKVA